MCQPWQDAKFQFRLDFNREYLCGGLVNEIAIDIFRIYTFISIQHQGPVKISIALGSMVLIQT